MERWRGKLAVVTGASAGVGRALCLALADRGLTVVGLARRAQLVHQLQSEVKGAGSVVARRCDVADERDLGDTFQWIEHHYGCVHVLINNAGVLYSGQITDVGEGVLSESSLLSTIDVNLKGPIVCAKHAVASMKKHDFNGHIITINSIAGHYVPFAPYFNVYPTTKHAITTFTKSLATELGHFSSQIKTTSLSPGLIATDMSGPATGTEAPSGPILNPADIADAVLYVLATPPHVNIDELTITPVAGLRL